MGRIMESLLKKYDLPAGALVPTVFIRTRDAFSWDQANAEVSATSPFTISMPTQTLNGSYSVPQVK
jgi:hypothetical protein